MFLTGAQIFELTGLKRPTAQARWLGARGYKFERRSDGTIALRLDEADQHTLSRPADGPKRRRALDLSLLRRAG